MVKKNSKKIKRIIWCSDIVLKDWILKTKDEMAEEYPEVCCDLNGCRGIKCEDCIAFFEFCCKLNNTYIEDERANLDISLDTPVIALAEIGAWDGVKYGYKLLRPNVNSIFSISEDINTYYADAYNIRATCVHHDGANHILYRSLKKNISIDQLEKILYDNKYKLSSQQISRYTDSLLPYVKQMYGW